MTAIFASAGRAFAVVILVVAALSTGACSTNSSETVIIEETDAGVGGPPPVRGAQGGDADVVDNQDGAVSPETGADDAGAEPGNPDASQPADAPTVIPPRPEVPPGVELSRGLIFYLALDDGPGAEVRDSSANANKARLTTSDPAGAWTGGWRGMALRFSGGGSTQLAVESSLSLDTIADGFTIAFWYRRDKKEDAGVFLSRSAPMDRGCLYCADLVDNHLRLQINSPIMYRADVRTDQPFPTGRWVHLAFTYDQVTSQAQIWVDGSVAARGMYAHPIGPQVRPIVMGEGLTGTMDEITLHSRALSADEIHAMTLGADPLR
jgi:hypothetical protein